MNFVKSGCLLAAMVLSAICYAQTSVNGWDKTGSAAQMASMGEQQRVRFINKNFYKLYSTDFDNASALAKWASETSRKNGWAAEEAWAEMNWGVVTYLSSDYKSVLPHYFRSLHVFDSLEDHSGIAAVNNEMAVFYHKNKDQDKAEASIGEAEEHARMVNDLERLGTSLSHRGTWLAQTGNYKDARPYFEEVLKIRTELKDSVGLGYVYLDFAEMALSESNIDLTFKYLDLSTEIRKKIGDKQGVVVNTVNKGETYFNAKRYSEALPLFIKTVEEGKKIGYADLVRYAYDFVGRTYVELGDYRNAYKWQADGNVLKDSLFNIERTKVIEDLQTRYETEKKNQQIVMLDQENKLKEATIQLNTVFIIGLFVTIILLGWIFFMWRKRNLHEQQVILQEQKIRLREAQINAVIESQEQERKRFATDLHDGMGQLISALQLNINSLRQQTASADRPNSFERRDQLFEASDQLLTEVHDEIRNIAFNLMPPVLVKEGLIPAVQELVRKINKSGKIKATLSAFDVKGRFVSVAEISLYRVVQEFLSNIIKYSRASEVTISFTGYENELVLTIEDNGHGYDLIAFQNSKDGNGWRNVNSRINLIKGTIDIDTQELRKNSTVIITIPVSALQMSDISVEQNTEQHV